MKSRLEKSDKANYLNHQYDGVKDPKRLNASLYSFLRTEPLRAWLSNIISSGPWCEIGCGAYGLFEEGDHLIPGLSKKQDLYGLDLSSRAIEMAPESNIHYAVADVSQGLPAKDFSFVLDGHLLHCLDSLPELFQTLGAILHSLKPGGLFAGEVMIAHKNLSFDHDLSFDFETNILSFEGRSLRIILEPREWEELFINAGFEIQFFVCQSSIKMIPNRERKVPMTGDPECLRFVLKRPLKEME